MAKKVADQKNVNKKQERERERKRGQEKHAIVKQNGVFQHASTIQC